MNVRRFTYPCLLNRQGRYDARFQGGFMTVYIENEGYYSGFDIALLAFFLWNQTYQYLLEYNRFLTEV